MQTCCVIKASCAPKCIYSTIKAMSWIVVLLSLFLLQKAFSASKKKLQFWDIMIMIAIHVLHTCCLASQHDCRIWVCRCMYWLCDLHAAVVVWWLHQEMVRLSAQTPLMSVWGSHMHKICPWSGESSLASKPLCVKTCTCEATVIYSRGSPMPSLHASGRSCTTYSVCSVMHLNCLPQIKIAARMRLLVDQALSWVAAILAYLRDISVVLDKAITD